MKKFFTLLFAMMASVGMMFAESGTCGDNVTWNITNGVLTISGTGAMTDYAFASNLPWKDKGVTSVVINGGVTSIGTYAFYNCTGLTSVSIGNSVTSIREHAFAGCEDITSITIPNSVANIGSNAFSDCSGLTSVTIGNGVRNIGSAAFCDCSNLISVEIPNGVTSIEASTFRRCYSLSSVTIPNSVTSIGNAAFEGCSLTSVTISNNVTEIGEYAFNGCDGLTSITIPESVYYIGNQAFAYCDNLTSVIWNASYCDDFTYGYNSPFRESNLTSITFGEAVTRIPKYLCNGLENLTSVSISNSVTSIGQNAFQYCKNLVSLTFGEGLQSIEYGAFENCTSLKSLVIPNSVNSVNGAAFYYCTGIVSIEGPACAFDIAEHLWTSYTSQLDTAKVTSGTLTENALGFIKRSYKTLKSLDISAVENTTLADEAFKGCYKLKELLLPSNLTEFGYMALAECSGLTSISIPNSVTSIGDKAFWYCSGLTSIKCYASKVPALGDYVFQEVNKSIPLYVPEKSVNAYKAADGWKEFTNIQAITGEILPDEPISQNLKATPNGDGTYTISWSPLDQESGLHDGYSFVTDYMPLRIDKWSDTSAVTFVLPWAGTYTYSRGIYDEAGATVSHETASIVVNSVEEHNITTRVLVQPDSRYVTSNGVDFYRHLYDGTTQIVHATNEGNGWWTYTWTTTDPAIQLGLSDEFYYSIACAQDTTCVENSGYELYLVDCDAQLSPYFPKNLKAVANGDGTYTISWDKITGDKYARSSSYLENNVGMFFNSSLTNDTSCVTSVLPFAEKYTCTITTWDNNGNKLGSASVSIDVKSVPEHNITTRVLVQPDSYDSTNGVTLYRFNSEGVSEGFKATEEGNGWYTYTWETTDPGVLFGLNDNHFWDGISVNRDTCLEYTDGSLHYASCDAHINKNPTQADLQPYMKEGYYVACFSTPAEATCNDIVWMGTYCGWTIPDDLSELVQCQKLPGYEGWYVAVVPAGAYVNDVFDPSGACDGKPVQLNECGKFDWNYQNGTASTVDLVAGSVNIVDNGPEADLKNWSTTQPTIITMSAWKKSPCEYTCDERQYTIRVYAPDCPSNPEFKPTIIGSFNFWARPLTMNLVDGEYYEAITPATTAKMEFKFNNDSAGLSWDNQFEYFVPVDEENDVPAHWKAFENFTLNPEDAMSKFYTRSGDTLTFDFSDTEKYRYPLCSMDTSTYKVVILAKLPAKGMPEAGVEVMGNFGEDTWDNGVMMVLYSPVPSLRYVYKAELYAKADNVFKFREAGNWANQVVTIDGEDLQFKFGDEWEDESWKDEYVKWISLDFSDTTKYIWKSELVDPTDPTEPTSGEYTVTYVDKDDIILDSEIITLNLPEAPEIEGFAFLYWQPVAKNIKEGITVQAVYEAVVPQSTPAEVSVPGNPAQKLIRNGNVYILRSDKVYTITGQQVK